MLHTLSSCRGTRQQLQPAAARPNACTVHCMWLSVLLSQCGGAAEQNDQLTAMALAVLVACCAGMTHLQPDKRAASILTADCSWWPPEHRVNTNSRWMLLQDLQELVSHCLQKEPAERWTARQLLKHRFWKVRLCSAASMLLRSQ